jgi:hypothetical protein
VAADTLVEVGHHQGTTGAMSWHPAELVHVLAMQV